ncbi:VPLPA-CTERM sorting domain-containing protein [Jannaschia sp. CCS1]|uniref:VPLPA-CTERM sorting domain-containing protein n=1 Tax=Jannaschia sp. (strain CCS1) TaxID=290400 RepID=UPI000053C7F0|nr:VPLPA-CTERM sorting domain-containing protein [Jannaschia sp. CCS1]ABD54045.1 hypothetical protein Jann_1128 [Jannaschia sp. CCS1]
MTPLAQAAFAATLALSATLLHTQAQAAPVSTVPGPNAPQYIDVRFNFFNLANGFNAVEGVVRGLSLSGTSAAYSVEITANSAGFGIGEYVGNPLANSWTVLNGEITQFEFYSAGAFNTAPTVTTATFGLSNTPGSPIEGEIGLGASWADAETEDLDGSGLYFTALRRYDRLPVPRTRTQLAGAISRANLSETAAVAPVPLPAGIWLLLASLAGMTGLRRLSARPKRSTPMATMAGSLALCLGAASAAQATPVGVFTGTPPANYYDYSFRFVDAVTNDISAGIIRGLSANGTSAAYSVEVTASQGVFGMGEYVGTPIPNLWTVQNGVIQSVEFFSYGAANTAPAVTTSTLIFSSNASMAEAYSGAHANHPIAAGFPENAETGLTFEVLSSYHSLPLTAWGGAAPRVPDANPFPTRGTARSMAAVSEVSVAPVPLPAGVWLLLVSLGGLAGLRRLRA